MHTDIQVQIYNLTDMITIAMRNGLTMLDLIRAGQEQQTNNMHKETSDYIIVGFNSLVKQGKIVEGDI